MLWIAPSEKDTDNAALEKRLWDAADQFRANSGLKSQEYSAPGRFDFVLANPPFNVNAVDTAMRVSARRHPEGTPQDLPERQDHERLNDMVGPGRRFSFDPLALEQLGFQLNVPRPQQTQTRQSRR